MPKAFSSEEERNAFLAEPRLAILNTNRPGDTPLAVPVWYEWTGSEILMFSGKGVPKLKRIEGDPKVQVLVTNRVGEPEAWVSFEGEMEICPDEDPWPLIERIAPRYWDVEAMRDVLDEWQAGKEHMVVLRMKPTRIRDGR